MKCIHFIFIQIGRRKKLIKNSKQFNDRMVKNRDIIKSSFAQHVINNTIEHKMFGSTILDKSRRSVIRKRKKRNDYIDSNNYCQREFEQLLKIPEVNELLLAASNLWKYWNHELMDMAMSLPIAWKFDAKLSEINKKITSLGHWSKMIAKYGIHWINEMFPTP